MTKDFNMSMISRLIPLGIIALFTVSVISDTRDITKDQVPDAVLQSFLKTFPYADTSAQNYTMVTRGEKTYYKITSEDLNFPQAILFDPDGNLVESVNKIPYDSLPAPVQDSIKSTFGNDSVLIAERVFKNDQTTYGAIIKSESENLTKFFKPDGSTTVNPISPDDGYQSNEAFLQYLQGNS
jgi:hypothetical protein